MTALQPLFLVLLCLWATAAHALPNYAQRSGRTCANCHASPTLEDPEGWEDPELMDRKCTMSCVSCHVDPSGGGLRNTSGRYFGQSTLGMVHSQDRSYSDRDRELFREDFLWRVQQYLKAEQAAGAVEGRSIPSDLAEAEAGVGGVQTGRGLQGGHVAAGPIAMSFWDGRYGDLDADPVWQLGGDFRFAYWSGVDGVFPMQTDLHLAVHPVHHLSAVATLAGRSRTNTTWGDVPVFPRRAFLMAHELPGMSWAKAGVFLPGYGVYIADHTAPTRDWFEMDVSGSEDTVAGVELGTAPNYPFATVSVFANDSSPVTGGVPDQGWGAAASGGWRDLGWSLTAHGQLRDRGGQGRGDFLAGGIGFGFNPAYYAESLPLTWIGEASMGQRTVGADRRTLYAIRSEWSWIVRNGLLLELRSDLGDSDLAVAGDRFHRHGLGLVLTPAPGWTFDPQVRVLLREDGPPVSDVFGQVHVWF